MQVEQKNIDIVINALKDFYNRIIQTGSFDIAEFINFLEPKFTEAGYRESLAPNLKQTNILIIHDAGVGDFIIQSATVREIRRLYPTAQITLLITKSLLNMAECCPYVDKIILSDIKYRHGDFNEMYPQSLSFAEKNLLPRHFDICYALALLPLTFFTMYLSGAAHRIATPIYADAEEEYAWTATRWIPYDYLINLANHIVPRYPLPCHRVDSHLAVVDYFLHAPVANRKMEVWYTARDAAVAESYLQKATKPIYGFSMASSHPRKCYPPEMYAKVFEMILAEEPTATFVILCGGEYDLTQAETLKNSAPKIYAEHTIDTTDKISYRKSAAVLKNCDMYIGNDTSPLHMAATLNVPVLEIMAFPADLPLKAYDEHLVYYPYGVPNVIVQPAHALPECANPKFPHNAYGCKIIGKPHCITQIKPETVFKGFKLLKERIAQKIIEPLYIH